MARASDVIIISPLLLRFHAPYDRREQRSITIMNTSDYTILYKVKTNTFKVYSVKPNCHKIDPYETVQVDVTQNPFDYNANDVNHKFIVQTLIATKPEWIEDPIKAFEEVKPSLISSMRIDVSLDVDNLIPNNMHGLKSKASETLIERVLREPESANLAAKSFEKILRPVCNNCERHHQHVDETVQQKKDYKMFYIKRIVGIFICLCFILIGFYIKSTIEDDDETYTTAY